MRDAGMTLGIMQPYLLPYIGYWQLLAAVALSTSPDALRWDNGTWVGGDSSQVKTIEDIALYAHGTGALPPGVEGGLDAQTVYRD